VTGLRAAAFLTAGIARVPFGRFLAADTAAATIGVPVTFGLAFFFAAQLQQIQAGVHRAERWAVVLALLVAGAWIAVRAYRRSHALEREARAGSGKTA
jgi:membrane protein DedA with SNARE-associated domain